MSEVYRRFRSMGEGEKMEDSGKIRLLASTDEPVSWGGWREILSHKEGAVDMSAARSLLVNHDPDQLCGSISGMTLDGRNLTSEAEIDEDARMQSGVSVRKSVAKKRLNGVSIGYTYDRADAVFDEDTRTLTVNKWRLLEISLTPIPADKRAQVRSLPEGINQVAPATEKKESRVSDDTKAKPNSPGQESANTLQDETVRAREMASIRERAEKAERKASLLAFGAEHQVDLSKFDFETVKTEADGLRAISKLLAEKNAKPAGDATSHPIARTRVVSDQLEKTRDAITGALAYNAGFRTGEAKKLQDGNPMVGKGIQGLIREWAEDSGERTGKWDKRDVAHYALGRPDLMSRSAANVTSSNFTSFVMLNAITKITAMGFERGSASSRYNLIVSRQTVPDFKQFTIGALAAGNLTNTVEDVALPELTKTDGAYNSTAKTWGGTLSLTLQALVNDDTGAFSRVLSQAGTLLDKTIDRRTFQKLLMGTSTAEATSTWTSNTTSGGSLVYTTQDLMAAARGKLGVVRTALQNKVGLDGNPMGTLAKFLICGPTREMEAMGITGNSGPGLQAGAQQPAVSMQVISSAWLEASALTGNSTTSYYLLADPNEVTGLVLSTVQGYEGINVEQYDPGAVLAMKWKLWSPFEVDLFNAANSAGTTTVPAAQQGTT